MELTSKTKVVLGALGALTMARIACWVFQLANGLGVTGMSNATSWGLYICMFMFFVGLSAGDYENAVALVVELSRCPE